jgi:hypothetical protein
MMLANFRLVTQNNTETSPINNGIEEFSRDALASKVQQIADDWNRKFVDTGDRVAWVIVTEMPPQVEATHVFKSIVFQTDRRRAIRTDAEIQLKVRDPKLGIQDFSQWLGAYVVNPADPEDFGPVAEKDRYVDHSANRVRFFPILGAEDIVIGGAFG